MSRCPDYKRTFRERNELRERKKYICERQEEVRRDEQDNMEKTNSEPEQDAEHWQLAEDTTREKQTEMVINISKEHKQNSGYMEKPGQPRQPKKHKRTKREH